MSAKGKTNNPSGRPAGKPNVITSEMRIVLKKIILKEFESLPELLENIEPEKRIELLIKLMPFVFPKVEAVSMSAGEPWD